MRVPGLTLGLSILLLSGAAQAQQYDMESPRSMAMELRFNFYEPNIESEFGGATNPYKSAFGDDTAWMISSEVDYQFWQGFGSLGAFGMIGYGELSGNGITADGKKSSDETSFTFIPFTAGLVYRFDILSVKYGIPIAFAFKGGVDCWLWSIDDGVGKTAAYKDASGATSDGAGSTFGLYGAVGLHILLDFFEPHAARVFDNDLGVNNSYLFVEWSAHWLDDFGSSSSFDLSDGNFVFGLAFEM